MITFKPRITVPHGSLLSAKNAHRITVRSTRPTDHNGNTLGGAAGVGTYFCRYRIKKEKEGFIFREVRNGSGISGHSPTVRELVINAARFDYLLVEFDAEGGAS